MPSISYFPKRTATPSSSIQVQEFWVIHTHTLYILTPHIQPLYLNRFPCVFLQEIALVRLRVSIWPILIVPDDVYTLFLKSLSYKILIYHLLLCFLWPHRSLPLGLFCKPAFHWPSPAPLLWFQRHFSSPSSKWNSWFSCFPDMFLLFSSSS